MNIWPIARDFVNFLTISHKSTEYGGFSIALLVLFLQFIRAINLDLLHFSPIRKISCTIARAVPEMAKFVR